VGFVQNGDHCTVFRYPYSSIPAVSAIIGHTNGTGRLVLTSGLTFPMEHFTSEESSPRREISFRGSILYVYSQRQPGRVATADAD